VTEPTRTQQLRERWGVREVDRRRLELEQKAATQGPSDGLGTSVKRRRKRAPQTRPGRIEFAVSQRHEPGLSFADAAQIIITMRAFGRYFKQRGVR
jgi:hypothetical protein